MRISARVENERGSHDVRVVTGDQGRALEVMRRLAPGRKVNEDQGYLVLEAEEDLVPEMVRRLVSENIEVQAVIPARDQGLEDMFLELTASEADQEQERPS